MLKRTIVILILWLSVFSLIGCSSAPSSTPMSRPAPDFSLRNMSDENITLSGLKGKTVLINFWQTTCPPCVAEMPEFESLQHDWKNRDDVKILMINTGESKDIISRFLIAHKYTFTVLQDERYDVIQKYSIRYTPTTLVIDKEGNIRSILVGPYKNKAAIEKQVAPYLN